MFGFVVEYIIVYILCVERSTEFFGKIFSCGGLLLRGYASKVGKIFLEFNGSLVTH